MENHKVIRPGAYGILQKGNFVLLCQKKSGPYALLWDLPGGGIEFGESPDQTVTREILEETGLVAQNIEFLYVTTATTENLHQIAFVYKILNYVSSLDVSAEEIFKWVDLNHIDEKLTPVARFALDKMLKSNFWRPNKAIRGKAMALARRKNEILVCEVLDDEGRVKGWCPLGGGIEFGEASQDALKREIYEELDSGIRILGNPFIAENIFDHHDVMGHEIVFAFPSLFEKAEIYFKDRFQIFEHNGFSHWVEWIDIERFRSGELVFFPQRILDLYLDSLN